MTMNDDNAEHPRKDDIVDAYLKIIANKKKLPTISDFVPYTITRDTIRRAFGNFEKLHDHMQLTYPEKIEKHFISDKTIFSSLKLKELGESLKDYQRFVVTTAVNQKAVNTKFYAAIKNYCVVNNAKLLVMPCSDIWDRASGTGWSMDPIFKDDLFVTEDTKINENLFLSSIKISAKQINPTTGLSRIGQRNGSYIFSAPKQSLEFVVNGRNNKKIPHAIMTPGAITVSDYSTDRYMSERVSYIAESDHVTRCNYC